LVTTFNLQNNISSVSFLLLPHSNVLISTSCKTHEYLSESVTMPPTLRLNGVSQAGPSNRKVRSLATESICLPFYLPLLINIYRDDTLRLLDLKAAAAPPTPLVNVNEGYRALLLPLPSNHLSHHLLLHQFPAGNQPPRICASLPSRLYHTHRSPSPLDLSRILDSR
jgi:hypothetical protein